jgi:hypothetical protein
LNPANTDPGYLVMIRALTWRMVLLAFDRPRRRKSLVVRGLPTAIDFTRSVGPVRSGKRTASLAPETKWRFFSEITRQVLLGTGVL